MDETIHLTRNDPTHRSQRQKQLQGVTLTVDVINSIEKALHNEGEKNYADDDGEHEDYHRHQTVTMADQLLEPPRTSADKFR
jgi:hypothetical protein